MLLKIRMHSIRYILVYFLISTANIQFYIFSAKNNLNSEFQNPNCKGRSIPSITSIT